MAIKVSCKKCGKQYQLKEEMAGRKFRCKACEAPVAVPQAAVDEFDNWDDLPEPSSTPPQPKSSKRSGAKSGKKRGKKKSSSVDATPFLMIGGVVVGLLVLGLVIWGGLKFLPQVAGGGGSGAVAPDGTNWTQFTIPGESISVRLPMKPEVRSLPNGATAYLAVHQGVTYSVGANVPPMPNLAGETDDEVTRKIFEATATLRAGLDAESGNESKLMKLGGREVIRASNQFMGKQSETVSFFYQGKLIMLGAAVAQEGVELNSELVDYFLNSLQIR